MTQILLRRPPQGDGVGQQNLELAWLKASVTLMAPSGQVVSARSRQQHFAHGLLRL